MESVSATPCWIKAFSCPMYNMDSVSAKPCWVQAFSCLDFSMDSQCNIVLGTGVQLSCVQYGLCQCNIVLRHGVTQRINLSLLFNHRSDSWLVLLTREIKFLYHK
jgi:hypothetical protein